MSATISILGNLGQTPEARFTPNGTFVVNFSIADNFVRQTPTGAVEQTNWYRITAFGNQAETLARHAKKGNQLLIEGKLTFNPWLNRQETPQIGAEVLLQNFQFAGKNKPEDEPNRAENEQPINPVQPETVSDVQEISDQILSY